MNNWFITNAIDPRRKDLKSYDEDYRKQSISTVKAIALFSYARGVQNGVHLSNTILNDSGLSTMLSEFKEKMITFCKDSRNVCSVWICIDNIGKDVTIFTVTDEWDFDLEGEIFNGPYSDLPVRLGDYYIEQRVTHLGGDKVVDIIPSGCQQIYSRTD